MILINIIKNTNMSHLSVEEKTIRRFEKILGRKIRNSSLRMNIMKDVTIKNDKLYLKNVPHTAINKMFSYHLRNINMNKHEDKIFSNNIREKIIVDLYDRPISKKSYSNYISGIINEANFLLYSKKSRSMIFSNLMKIEDNDEAITLLNRKIYEDDSHLSYTKGHIYDKKYKENMSDDEKLIIYKKRIGDYGYADYVNIDNNNKIDKIVELKSLSLSKLDNPNFKKNRYVPLEKLGKIMSHLIAFPDKPFDVYYRISESGSIFYTQLRKDRIFKNSDYEQAFYNEVKKLSSNYEYNLGDNISLFVNDIDLTDIFLKGLNNRYSYDKTIGIPSQNKSGYYYDLLIPGNEFKQFDNINEVLKDN